MPAVLTQVDPDDLRELDKRVAHEVMGLVPCDSWRRTNLGSAGGPVLMRDGGCEHGDGSSCYPRLEIASIHGPIGGVPRYSTRINLAMKVVEKMRERDWRVSIMNNAGAEKSDLEWSVDFARGRIVNRMAATLPEAICRAALAAMENNK